MNPNLVILIILIINTIGAFVLLFYDTITRKDKMKWVHFVVILLCPVVGFCLFLGAYILERMSIGDKDIAYADIGFDTTKHIKKIKGDYREEVDILSLDEAFVVSEKKDRRKALLTVLKRDFNKNITAVIQGVNNEDTETSHYAASVVLSTTTDYLNHLANLRKAYNEMDEDPEPAIEYLEFLKKFIESDIMDNVDREKYAKIFTEVLDRVSVEFNETVTVEYMIFAIKLMIDSQMVEESKKWADRTLRFFPEEGNVYFAVMKMHYDFGEHEEFIKLLHHVMDSNLSISNDILQTIRFFSFQPQ